MERNALRNSWDPTHAEKYRISESISTPLQVDTSMLFGGFNLARFERYPGKLPTTAGGMYLDRHEK
jgi:hypothetical protein